MKKYIIFAVLLFALVFSSGCISSDPVLGTWVYENYSTPIMHFNEGGTGSFTYEHGNGLITCPITWTQDGDTEYYLLDFPDNVTVSADGTTMTFDTWGVCTGNGFVGTWEFNENYISSLNVTGKEYVRIFDDHTGIMYMICADDPLQSWVDSFSWKQVEDGSYYFYDYHDGFLCELSEDGKTQTFTDGAVYTGNGLIGAWNRTVPADFDGTMATGQRIFNADGTAVLTWYYQNGSVYFVYDQTWVQLSDRIYAVLGNPQPIAAVMLNDDGSMSYWDEGKIQYIFLKQE